MQQQKLRLLKAQLTGGAILPEQQTVKLLGGGHRASSVGTGRAGGGGYRLLGVGGCACEAGGGGGLLEDRLRYRL